MNNKINAFIKLKMAETMSALTSKEIFLKAVYETLSDVEDDHSELVLANYESPKYDLRVDGYDYLDEDTIDFYISDYDISNNDLSESELLKYVNQIKNFILKSTDDLYSYLDSTSAIADVSEYIHYNNRKIKDYRIFIITNKLCSKIDNLEDTVDGKKIIIKIYDKTSLEEFNTFDIENNKIVDVDLKNEFNLGIDVVKNQVDFDKFDSYMFFIPGIVLAKTYEKHGYSFLAGNVRAYLKKTQKVNKQIFETIKEDPYLFVAYNNGLSTVASNIDFTRDGKISKIYGWQIVNGGQTTATIYEALKSNIDLSKVFVPVKLSLLKTVDNSEEMISRISEYANTQSKVNQSDFSSNEKFHVEIEKLSKRVCIPSDIKNEEFEKWFYERTKGQYDLNKSRDDSGLFVKEYPKDKRITKVDLAKAIMCWEQEPYTASLGGEKNFWKFNTRLKANEDFITINEDYYKKMVAAYILFKQIDYIVGGQSFGGYKNNIDYYSYAYISYIVNKKLDFIKIWNEQGINDKFVSFIKDLSMQVYKKINETPENNRNVAMWCRNEQCWKNIKTIDVNCDALDEYLIEDEIQFVPANNLLIVDDMEIDVSKVTSNEWFALSKWGKETDMIKPDFRSMAYSTGINVARGKELTTKQMNFAKIVLKDAYSKGFKYTEEE